MAFDFKPPERKGPKEYGGSPAKALMAEITEFAKQRQRYGMRQFAGLEKDEEPEQEAAAPMSPEECAACKDGTCDDPEHMGEEEKAKLVIMLEPSGKE